MTTNAEVWELAVTSLTPEELAACFLGAFHKLEPADKDLIEDTALVALTRMPVLKPDDALELVGHAAVVIATEVPRGQLALLTF